MGGAHGNMNGFQECLHGAFGLLRRGGRPVSGRTGQWWG